MPGWLSLSVVAFTVAIGLFVYVIRVGNPVWEHWGMPHLHDCANDKATLTG